MIATCTREGCGLDFDGEDTGQHTQSTGHDPQQHYEVVVDLSATGNAREGELERPVQFEIPASLAAMIRAGMLNLAIVADPEGERGLAIVPVKLA